MQSRSVHQNMHDLKSLKKKAFWGLNTVMVALISIAMLLFVATYTHFVLALVCLPVALAGVFFVGWQNIRWLETPSWALRFEISPVWESFAPYHTVEPIPDYVLVLENGMPKYVAHRRVPQDGRYTGQAVIVYDVDGYPHLCTKEIVLVARNLRPLPDNMPQHPPFPSFVEG